MSTYTFLNEHRHEVIMEVDRDTKDGTVGITLHVDGHEHVDVWLTNIEAGTLLRMLHEEMPSGQ